MRWLLVAALAALLPGVAVAAEPGAFAPWWAQNHRVTQLWSGADARAIAFGEVSQWSYFRVVEPQNGSRLYVYDPRTRNYAYIDALAVGPSGPPPGAASPGGSPSPGTSGSQQWWVMNFKATHLWSSGGPDALDLGWDLGPVPQWRYFQVVSPQDGPRLYVFDPLGSRYGFIDADEVGPVSAPPRDYLDPAPPATSPVNLPGRTVGQSVVYSRPWARDYTSLFELPSNSPIFVLNLVPGRGGEQWVQIGREKYLPLSHAKTPKRPAQPLPGRWIDADLTEPVMVTAYENDKPVYAALAVKGTIAFSTPTGTFEILRRVASETMDSATLGIPRDSPNGYYLKDVLYTQYFTWDGASLHYNYWRSNFGFAGSHGCLGLTYDDAKWFWDWAAVGTPVVIHY